MCWHVVPTIFFIVHAAICLLAVQGEADSALDHLWAAKKAEIGQGGQ